MHAQYLLTEPFSVVYSNSTEISALIRRQVRFLSSATPYSNTGLGLGLGIVVVVEGGGEGEVLVG